MNSETANKIMDAICKHDTIIVSRHIRPDGDAIGASKGLCEVLRDSFPDKKIHLVNSDYSTRLDFLNDEKTDIPDEAYENALVIVVDTATENRISNQKYKLGKLLIKIDHHVDILPFGDISWVEDQRNSASEMIADFCMTQSDKLTTSALAAKYLYAGITTDTGRFKFTPKGNELRIAAWLLDKGIDTETLFANLYLDSFDHLKFRAYVFGKMEITQNGVAYIYVDADMQRQWNLTSEEASSVVSLLDSIKGSLVWAAFIDNPDGTIRVRLRSRFMTINKLAERYRGGGHEKAAGAVLYEKAEISALLSEADSELADYKATNKGWL